MHFKELETEQKLRGAYYTPEWLADFVARWLAENNVRSVMEPSCGDGVFLRALASQIKDKKLEIFGMDINPDAVSQCCQTAFPQNIHASVVCDNYLSWALRALQSEVLPQYDAVCGNPPFIRYQYLEKEQQKQMQEIFSLLGLRFTKHTNIWIAFLILAVHFLRPGGLLAMVIPSEIIHVSYAAGARDYLEREAEWIHLLDPEDLWFENTSQGTVLLFLQKRFQRQAIGSSLLAITPTSGQSFTQKSMSEIIEETNYLLTSHIAEKWTTALLTSEERAAWNKVLASPEFARFGELADITVGIVTGANDFFCVPDAAVSEYGLEDVVMPAFRKSNHVPGVIFDANIHRQNKQDGKGVNFLYFESEKAEQAHKDYLDIGIQAGLPNRYKCRVRKPWYKVPSVWAAPLAMFNMVDKAPRLIYNAIGAITTDTACRVTPKPDVDPKKLAYCFVNTVTALSAELEGRSYGGGVLELIPSETARLVVPYFLDVQEQLLRLDVCITEDGIMTAMQKQDDVLFRRCSALTKGDVEVLRSAFMRLQARRRKKI